MVAAIWVGMFFLAKSSPNEAGSAVTDELDVLADERQWNYRKPDEIDLTLDEATP